MTNEYKVEIRKIGELPNTEFYSYSTYRETKRLGKAYDRELERLVESSAENQIMEIKSSECRTKYLCAFSDIDCAKNKDEYLVTIEYLSNKTIERYFPTERHMAFDNLDESIKGRNIFSVALENLNVEDPSNENILEAYSNPSNSGDNHSLWKKVMAYSLGSGLELPLLRKNGSATYLELWKLGISSRLYGFSDERIDMAQKRWDLYNVLYAYVKKRRGEDLPVQKEECIRMLREDRNLKHYAEGDFERIAQTFLDFRKNPKEMLTRIFENEEAIAKEVRVAFFNEGVICKE
jgi:hypothetical protein